MIALGWTARGAARHNGKMSIVLAILGLMFGSPTVWAAAIQNVDVTPQRVTIAFDDYVEDASAFILDNPRRLAIDISGARSGNGGRGAGPVAQVRQGQYDANTARVVFELARPVTFANGEFSHDGRSFSLDIQPASQLAFTSAATSGRARYLPPVAFRARPPQGRGGITVRLPPARRVDEAPLPQIQGPRGRPLVVIDAGHGGHDPGAISPFGSRREKDATLAIARAIRDRLIESGRVRVALTRDDDRFIILNERYEIARRLNADLFISVHADSAENASARGATIYTLSEVASDRESARLARRENSANIINGIDLGGEDSDVRSILLDLTRRETMNVSTRFADLLFREGGNTLGFRSDYHRFAGFVVLKAPDTPSILLETGYLTNEDDVRRLYSRDGQQEIAAGVARAVETHFARRVADRR